MKIVEASLVVPLTCLIMAALIALMMQFYQDLDRQIEQHDADRGKVFRPAEISCIRAQDRLRQTIGQEQA